MIGVGVPLLEGPSPQFNHKYPASHDRFPLFLTIEDLPEVCNYFIKKYSLSAEVTTEVCEKLLEFTSGHLFPFVTFAQHLLDPNSKIDLSEIDNFLSGKEFRTSDVCLQVRERCFDFLISQSLTKAENLLLSKGSSGDRDALVKLGVWSRDGFVSPLLTSEVFLKLNIPRSPDEIALDETQMTSYAQQIIYAGLRDMTEEDFKDVHYDLVPVENAVGFKWAYYVLSVISNVWCSPQVRTKYAEHAGKGAKPLIDFYFNGRVNMGIELALNLKFDGKGGIRDHLERFKNDYARYEKTGVVLHFETESSKVPDVAEGRLYTFVKKRNELYHGSTLVMSNVARKLPSPPARSFSTIRNGLECLRRVVQGLK